MNEQQSLLPGIPDRITIEGILTKAPWRTLCTLSAVSRAWRDALQSRRVYEARTCISSTKTLVVLIHNSPATECAPTHSRGKHSVPAHWLFAISLYDPEERSWSRLPSIPGVTSGVPKNCGCVLLDGRLYILGGDDYDKVCSIREVYMIDLAACRGVWQKCPSMLSMRSEFASASIHGRIYVFGGGCRPQIDHSREAEVFDPERNKWRQITDMMHPRTNHVVVNLEGRLLVLGGSVWLDDENEIIRVSGGEDVLDHVLHPTFAEVYDPRKNKWRRVEDVTKKERDDAFVMVNGKLHVLRPDSVHVYDVSSNTWAFVQAISWEFQLRTGAKDCIVRSATFADGEIVAFVGRYAEEDYGLMLLKSRGFRRKNLELTWGAIASPYVFDTDFHPLCSVQL